jgi:hypothetical protein
MNLQVGVKAFLKNNKGKYLLIKRSAEKYKNVIREIETSLGRKIDLVTEKSLNKFVRPHVLLELKTIYEV